MKAMILLALALLQAPLARAELRETASMADALKDADAQTLVVLDIDNTLLEPVQTIGSDQWWEHVYDKLVKDGMAAADAELRAQEIWNGVQAITEVRPVEAQSPELVAALQTRKIKVMALTARPLAVAEVTLRELTAAGYDLKKSPPSAPELAFAPVGDGLENPARFTAGVLFANGNDKGKLLLAYLAKIGLAPQKVIFVDDKSGNVKNVERALDGTKIAHVSFRYGAADARVKAFDPAVADIQYYFLTRILSDEAAAALKKTDVGAAPALQKLVNLPPWRRENALF